MRRILPTIAAISVAATGLAWAQTAPPGTASGGNTGTTPGTSLNAPGTPAPSATAGAGAPPSTSAAPAAVGGNVKVAGFNVLNYFTTFAPSLDHLVNGGRIVALPSLADLTPAKERGIEAYIPVFGPMPERLAELAPAIVAGDLVVEVSKVLALEQAAEAHRMLESGHSRGKIVLDVTV